MSNIWLDQITEDALLRELPPTLAANIRDLGAAGYDPEQIGALVAADPGRYLGTKSLGRVPPDLWAPSGRAARADLHRRPQV